MCGVHPNDCVDVDDYLKDKAYLPIGGKVFRIDYCIHQIVAALNAAGINTFGCCCGHGKTDGSILLEDGRELIIKNNQSTNKIQSTGPR